MFLTSKRLAWAVIVWAPRTPVERVLRHLMIEAPAGILNRVERGYVVVFMIFVLFRLMIWAGGWDTTVLIGMGSPEALAFLAMIDTATLVDVGLTALLVVSALRVRPLEHRAFN